MPFRTTRRLVSGAVERGQWGGGAGQIGAVATVSLKGSGPWAPCVRVGPRLGRCGGGGKGDLARLAALRAACLALRPTLVPSVGWSSLFGGWRVRWNAAWSVVRAALSACACSRLLQECIRHPLCARRAPPTQPPPSQPPPANARVPKALIPTMASHARLRGPDLVLHHSTEMPQTKAPWVIAIHLGGVPSRLLRCRAGGGGRV